MKQHGRFVSSFAPLTLCALAILAPLGLSSSTFAVSTATITGRVTDLNNAVISKARVEATNIDTNISYFTATNDEGIYVLPNLPPGRYRLFVSKEGFHTVNKPDVELHVQDVASISFSMQLGSINQSITIEGGAPIIQSESASVGTLVNRQFVENLPLNGRSFQSLITLTPGVVLTKSINQEQGQFSVNGQRANANYFTVDGVSANIGMPIGGNPGQGSSGAIPGFTSAGGTNGLVSVDALQEFKIQTSTYAPEFGRTPGAQIQIITRSGTNQFRGALFEYFRNDVLDANNWFTNRLSQKKPALRQNDFGFVLGGPVLLPRFGEGGKQLFYDGRNRTFFFVSYEGLRLRQPLIKITEVPSLSTRQNAVERIKPFLNAFPVPNGPNTSNGAARFSASYSDPSTLDSTSIRVDHTVSSKLTLFGRYNHAPSETDQRGTSFYSLNSVLSAAVETQTLTSGATMVLSPGLYNDLRINYSRNKTSSFLRIDDFGGATPVQDSLLFPVPYSSQDAYHQFTIVAGQIVLGAGKSVDHVQRQINLIDNLSVVTGPHQLKFGVDYRRLSPLYGIRKYQIIPRFPNATGAATGITSSTQIDASEPNTLFINNFSAYGQDVWKLTPRLTLTYGLRWELNPPPTGEKPLYTVTGLDNPASLALAPEGTPLYKTTYGNFAPRIGAAYRLLSRQGSDLVLRGGFGLFYDLGIGSLGGAVSTFPYSRPKNLSSTPFPLSPSEAALPPFTLTPQSSSVMIVADPNLELPLTYQWNIALEQSFGANQTISASYVAAVGRRLLRQELRNRPSQVFSIPIVYVTSNQATSDYHGLQLQYHRRLSRGLQALTSYTWSKSLDNNSNDSFLSNVPSARIDPGLDRGPSDFDVRHAFSGAITYNIPAPPAGAVVGAILRDFSIDTIFTARSPLPANVFSSRDIGLGRNFQVRPDLIPGTPLYINDPTAPGGKRFNRAAFSVPTETRQGTLGRNALRGFSVSQVDLALRRQFKLTEQVNIQFKGELFNIFNHPNFADPIGNLLSSQFGESTSMLGQSLGGGGLQGGFNPLYQLGGPRSVQLSLKLQF